MTYNKIYKILSFEKINLIIKKFTMSAKNNLIVKVVRSNVEPKYYNQIVYI
jgi:hypothetical protein